MLRGNVPRNNYWTIERMSICHREIDLHISHCDTPDRHLNFFLLFIEHAALLHKNGSSYSFWRIILRQSHSTKIDLFSPLDTGG